MTVTVCVPVWNGAAFVAETLESLRQQRLTDFRALIAVDHSDDDSLAVCQRFAQDARFTVTSHPERLGWVGNVNSLLDRVATPYACILPHDDLLEPDYLARLVGHLQAHPAAILAFTDVATFGRRDLVLSQRELIGERFTRVVTFLQEQVAAVGWRGVFRASVLTRGHRHRDEPRADTLWLLALAGEGELHRVPAVLYRKRVHDASARNQPEWHWPSPLVSWIDHCVACQQIALAAADWSFDERQVIAAAALARVFELNAVTAQVARAPDQTAALLSIASHFNLRLTGHLPRGAPPLLGTAAPVMRPRQRRKLDRRGSS